MILSVKMLMVTAIISGVLGLNRQIVHLVFLTLPMEMTRIRPWDLWMRMGIYPL